MHILNCIHIWSCSPITILIYCVIDNWRNNIRDPLIQVNMWFIMINFSTTSILTTVAYQEFTVSTATVPRTESGTSNVVIRQVRNQWQSFSFYLSSSQVNSSFILFVRSSFCLVSMYLSICMYCVIEHQKKEYHGIFMCWWSIWNVSWIFVPAACNLVNYISYLCSGIHMTRQPTHLPKSFKFHLICASLIY